MMCDFCSEEKTSFDFIVCGNHAHICGECIIKCNNLKKKQYDNFFMPRLIDSSHAAYLAMERDNEKYHR